MRKDNVKHESHRGIGFVVIAVALVLLIWYFAGLRSIGEVEAKDSVSSHQKYYTVVEIEEGDTLWAIADEYMTEEYEDKGSFIDEVCEMNHISGHMIRTGSTILVPYYK